MEMMLEEYKKLKSTPCPIRIVSEKDALKVLRHAKKARKEDFRKPLPKAKTIFLQNTDYSVLIPYYCITNGCFLSEEYEFLSSEEAIKEKYEFQGLFTKEELMNAKPKGIVIGRCPDGDVILLRDNRQVVRVSHEEPMILEQWPTLAQFFVDVINET